MPFRVCIIGETGHGIYAVRAVPQSDAFEITAVSDGAERVGCGGIYEACRKAGPAVKKYGDYIDMLDRERPDIAVVNGYCGLNARVSMECLKRGINVFTEKPAASTMADLEQLEACWRKSGAALSSMMAIRFEPWFQTAKRAVERGDVGAVRMINAQKSYKLGRRGGMYLDEALYGGTIPWVGSHAVDWAYWLSGKRFRTVWAAQSNRDNRGHNQLVMNALCGFQMEDDVLASVSIDFFRPEAAPTHDDDRVRVVGTDGVLEVREKRCTLMDDHGEHMLPLEPAKNVFLEFVKMLSGQENDAVSADDTIYITRACLAARAAAESGKIQFI